MIFIKRTKERGFVPLFCVVVIAFQMHSVESKSVVTTMSSTTESDSSTTPISTTTIKSEVNISESNTSIPPIKFDVKPVIGAEGESTETNSTNSNYITEYKPQVFDSPEDIKTQQEWGGNCTLKNWDQCKVLAKWFGKYEDPKDGEIKEYLIDCKEEPVVCLTNRFKVIKPTVCGEENISNQEYLPERIMCCVDVNWIKL